MNSNFGESQLSNYSKLDNIGTCLDHTAGNGTYGIVYKAKDNRTKELVAIKRIKPVNELENEGFPSTSIREISLLREIEHKNIIQYCLSLV
jgi:serine/threonine protein kinase